MASDKSKLSEAEELIKNAENLHSKIEQHEEKDMPNEIKAVKKDIEKFKSGDLSEDRLIRIIQEMADEENEQESIIQTEESAIKDEQEALKDFQGVLSNIETRKNNEEKMMDGVEKALGQLGSADSFRQGLKNAFSQTVKTVEKIDTDIDEEAEIARDLDVLSRDIAKTVGEEEELLKGEQKGSQLLKYMDEVLVKEGIEEGEDKLRNLEHKDEEEYQETVEELRQTENITQLEEKELRELKRELKRSQNDIERMLKDVENLKEEIEGKPVASDEKIRKLNRMEEKLNSDLEEVKEARREVEDAYGNIRSAESEESSIESGLA